MRYNDLSNESQMNKFVYMCCINREEKEIIESVIVATYYATKHWKQSGEVWENRKDIKNINGTDISIPYTILPCSLCCA